MEQLAFLLMFRLKETTVARYFPRTPPTPRERWLSAPYLRQHHYEVTVLSVKDIFDISVDTVIEAMRLENSRRSLKRFRGAIVEPARVGVVQWITTPTARLASSNTFTGRRCNLQDTQFWDYSCYGWRATVPELPQNTSSEPSTHLSRVET